MPLQKVIVSPMEITTENPAPHQPQSPPAKVENRAVTPERSSQTSSVSSNGFDICRICHCEGDTEVPLIAPCYCSGSLRYVHQACLQQWIKSSNIRCCELCKFQFIMQTKTKPFAEWEHLEMTGMERRKLLCAVLFHAVAVTCVTWSLYVLIDRTVEEIHTGILEWPFWTKLIVVAIGFTGGVVFMYIQCKAYLHICQRWKAYNRVIYVQNAPLAPEKPSLPSPKLAIKAESHTVHMELPSHICTPAPSYEEPLSWDENIEAPKSFDLTGVRNLHIFFNEENRIRVQKDEAESRLVDYLEGGGEPSNFAEKNSSTVENEKANGGGTTWHIQIEKTLGGPDITKSIDNRTYEEFAQDELMEPRPHRNEDLKPKSNEDTEPPVLNLQIKKAEIVIKFGNGSDSTNTLTTNEPVDIEKKSDIVVNAEEVKKGPEVVDVKKANVNANGFRADDEGSEDSLVGCDCRLLPDTTSVRPKTYLFDKRQSTSDQEMGSQCPLLAQTNTLETNKTN